MRIAFFSPLPPQRTGIADYSAALLDELQKLAEVTLFVEEPAAVASRFLPVRAVASFRGPRAERSDLCVYQMGNNVRYHRAIFAAALCYPGLTVLHDLQLYAFHDDLLVQGGRPGAYLREMGYAYDRAGVAAGLDLLDTPQLRDDARFPLLERVGQISLGLLVHSEYARRYVGRRCPLTPVRHVNQPMRLAVSMPAAAAAAKARLGYGPDDLLLTSFGYAAGSKRIDRVLPVLARLRADHPRLRYAVVGQVVAGYDVVEQASALGLDDMVRFTGFVEPAVYADYLAATDVGVNLRYPTTGETSAALLGLLAAGKPALVSNVDAFVELPDAACRKIDPGDEEAAQLGAAIELLAADGASRAAMGRAAQAYIADGCDLRRVAAEYHRFAADIVEEIVGRYRGPAARR